MSNCNFDDNKRTYGSLACERLIALLKNSDTGVQPFIQALVNQTQDINDILIGVLIGRCLDEAVGVQLDLIGELVGIKRPLVEGNAIDYITPDVDGLGTDSIAIWFVAGDPLIGFIPASDEVYRQYIRGKIIKNHVNSGSIADIKYFIQVVFGLESSVIKIDATTIDILLDSNATLQILDTIAGVVNNSLYENEYFLPIPMGVRLELHGAWILLTSFWNDDGAWFDNAIWMDTP